MKRITVILMILLAAMAICAAQADVVVTSDSISVIKMLTPIITDAYVDYGVIDKGQQQTFTVETTQDANYLFLYAESGVLVKMYKADGVCNDDGGSGKRVFRVQLAIGMAGDRTLTAMVGLNATPSSAPWELSFTVADTRIYDAYAASASIVRGGQQSFTVRTTSNAQYLMLYAEDGTLVKTWPASGNSTVSGAVRTWTPTLNIGSPGYRTLTFRAGTSTMAASNEAAVCFDVEDVLIYSVSHNAEIQKGGTLELTACTSGNAQNLMLYAENGMLVKNWNAADCSVLSGGNREWQVALSIGMSGDRVLKVRVGIGGKPMSGAENVSFLVTDTRVLSADGIPEILKRESQRFTVVTDKTANYLMLYAENGALVKAWPAAGNSSVNGSQRVWRVSLSIGSPGDRVLTFRAGAGDKAASNSVDFAFTVRDIRVLKAEAAKTEISKGEKQFFTVCTSQEANYLMLYAENGQLVKTWTAEGSSSIGTEAIDGEIPRIWDVELNIGSPGERVLTFKAGTSTTPISDGAAVFFTVKGTTIYAAYAESAEISKGDTLQFTVQTDVSAQYLMLYAEGGLQIKTWPAAGNSTVSGTVRNWKVSLGINSTGYRTLTFKAGTTATPASNSVDVVFDVLEVQIIDAGCEYPTITKGSEQVFTVTTSANAASLLMYAENGQLIKTLMANSGNDVLSDGRRIWQVTQNIGTAGDRTLYFQAATARAKSEKCGISFLVTDTAVYSASVQEPVIYKGGIQFFTVSTDTAAKYLMLYAEDGKTQVNRWTASANSTVTGGQRIWVVQQSIGSPGERVLYFRAGQTGTPASNACAVSFTVTAAPSSNTAYRALVIGEYSYYKPLWACAGDAEMVSSMLSYAMAPNGSRYQVNLQYNQDRDGIREQIESTFADADADDVSFFFISSHGVCGGWINGEYVDNGEEEGALMGVTPSGVVSYIPVYELAGWLSKIPGRVIVVIDACGSGAAIYDPDIPQNGNDAKSAQTENEIAAQYQAFNSAVMDAFAAVNETITVPNDIGLRSAAKAGEMRASKFYVLTASSYQQLSWTAGYEHSYFTNLLCTGINGTMPADTEGNNNGRLTLHELFSYISRHGDGKTWDTPDRGTVHQFVQVYPKNSGFEMFRR